MLILVYLILVIIGITGYYGINAYTGVTGITYSDHLSDDLTTFYLSWQDMITIASKIKVGKASTGIIRPEHFIQGAPGLLGHSHILFNGMIQLGYVLRRLFIL